ncbi:hypothetical protein [Saccharopolyspora taberi]|uniref:Uncharacterized protein n=1 Tax=Saccharopolyspora taberi TaxID=60895 RepID=A0ABN3UZU4_9PSEU
MDLGAQILVEGEPGPATGWGVQAGPLGPDEAVGFTGPCAGAGLARVWPPAELSEPGTPSRVSHFDRRHPAAIVADPVLNPEMTSTRR